MPRRDLSHELRKATGTSNFVILVPLVDLTGLGEFAAGGVRQIGRHKG
jgi:hypothetical protein